MSGPMDYGSLMDAEEDRLKNGASTQGVLPDYGALMSGEQNLAESKLAASLSYARKTAPDQYARVVGTARALQLPEAAVEGSPDGAEAQLVAKQARELLKSSPALAGKLSDPRFAKLSHDDVLHLAEVESMVNGSVGPVTGRDPTTGSYLSGLVDSFKTWVPSVKYLFADTLGREQMRAQAGRDYKQAELETAANTPRLESWLAQDVYSGLQSTVQQAPGIVAAVAAGNPAPAIAWGSLSQGVPQFPKYRERGAGYGQALLAAGAEGAAEGLFEAIPMSYVVNKMGRVGFGSFLAGLLGREIPSEIATTIVQNAIDTANANPDKTWGQYVEELPAAVRQTVVATTVQGSIMGGANSVLARVQKAAWAEAEAERLRKLNELAGASKTLERDPQTFADFVQSAADGGPLEAVHINAQVLMQSGVDLSQLSDKVKSDIADAAAVGADVRIPLGEYAAKLAPQGEKLLDHLKTSEDGFSKAEAATFLQEHAAAVKAQTEALISGSDQAATLRAEHDAIREHFLAQFAQANRFTSSVNDTQATLAANFYTTLAARLGITPTEALARYPLRIAAESIARETVLDMQQAAAVNDFAPGAVSNILQKDNWAILTAENPNAVKLDPAANAARMDRLREELKARGLKFEEVKGKYGNEENSLIVFGLPAADALELGHLFGQESVLTPHGLVYADGTVNPATGVKEYTEAPADFYTTVPSTGAMFGVDIDFDRRVSFSPRTAYAQSGRSGGDTQHAERARELLNALPEIPELSTVALMDGKVEMPKFATNDELAAYFTRKNRGQAKNLDSAAVRGRVADAIYAEALHALTDHGNAIGWYDAKTKAALEIIASVHPEILTDPRSRFSFIAILAVTSNGMRSRDNFVLAEKLYREHWKQTTLFPVSIPEAGPRRGQMEESFLLLNTLVAEHGWDAVRKFMVERHAAKEIAKFAGDQGTYGEQANAEMMGALYLGPKIGSYFNNLYGDFSTITMDRWFMRTMNRIRGRMLDLPGSFSPNLKKLRDQVEGGVDTFGVKAEKITAEIDAFLALPEAKQGDVIAARSKLKAVAKYAKRRHADYAKARVIDGRKTSYADRSPENTLAKLIDNALRGLQDSPGNDQFGGARDRAWMREVMADVQEKLAAGGIRMSNADLQAVLWYYEKDLYEKLKSDGVAEEDQGEKQAEDYETAARYAVGRLREQGLVAGPAGSIRAGQPAPSPVGGPGEQAGVAAAGQSDAAGGGRARDAAAGAAGAGRGLPRYGVAREGAVSVPAVHFSREARGAVTSAHWGSGLRDAAAARLAGASDARLKERLYFYVPEGKGVSPEIGVGTYAHGVQLDNVYDADSDPLKLRRNNRDDNAFESAVLDAGFDGYYARGVFGDQGVAVLLGKHAVDVERLGDKAGANTAVGSTSAPAGQYAPERLLAEAIAKDKRLPAGQLPGAAWLQALERSAPELFAQLTPEAKARLAASVEPMYKDQATRTFYQSSVSTRTPEFKKWFGDSVAREYYSTKEKFEDAPPLRLYVGRRADFAAFEAGRETTNSHTFGEYTTRRAAIFLSESPEMASDFAAGESGNVVPAYVRVENPLDLTGGLREDDEAKLAAGGVNVRVFYTLPSSDYWALFDEENGGKEFVAALKKLGYDGVVFNENRINAGDADKGGATGASTITWAVFSPEQIKSVFNARPTNSPNILEQGARGQISFGPDITQGADLSLLRNADLSTFSHELGHFFLEVMTHVASQPYAPEGIRRDMAAVLEWFGVKGAEAVGPEGGKVQLTALDVWRGMTIEQKRELHEKFARGFEAYLFEGKSPNIEMQGLFARFRAWMLNVYRELKNLNVELTDEVRGVFDRLLSTDEQIASAEAFRGMAPMFGSPEEAAASQAEWQSYQELGASATEDAKRELEKKALHDMKWLHGARSRVLKQLQEEAADKRRAIEAEVRAEVGRQAVYAAQNFLKKGVLPDTQRTNAERQVLDDLAGRPTRLSLPALKALYGDGPAAPWRYLSPSLVAQDGIHPDQVAELFGFSSGDHLVRSILAAEPQQSVIDGMTDQRMLERHGELTDPQALERAADRAVHNEARARFIAAELRFLERQMGVHEKTGRTDSKGRPTYTNVLAKAAKAFAEATIARKLVKDIRPTQYAAAEARAAKAALAAKSPTEKAVEKRNQLVNNYATKIAEDARAEVEKALRYLNKFNNDGTRKNVDPEYLAQIDQLLERFDLRPATQRALEKRASLAEWVKDQQEMGLEPTIDAGLLAEAQRKHYTQMTLEEFRGMVDAVKNIDHLGRLKRKLLTAKDERDFAAVVTELSDSIRANAKGTVKERRASERGPLVAIGALFRNFMADHRKFASLARQMDGWKDAGPMWERLVRTMNEAGNFEALYRERATMKLTELFAPILKGQKLGEKTFISAVGQSFTREELLGIALNTGNEVNRERVLTGEKWSPQQLNAVLDSLTKTDWDFVQSVWNYIESFRPEIGAKTERVTGVAPEWVEPQQVVTKHGVYKGGYYPIKYDPLRSSKSEADTAAEVQRQMERGLYTRAQTRRGHLEARVKSTGRPMRYDLGVIAQHVDQVIHDLAWHEWLIDANRLMRAEGVDAAIREHYGPEKLRTMKDTLRDIAVGEIGAQTAGESVLNYLRHGATIAGLGWRLSTALLQPIGLTQSMSRIGSKWVLKGAQHWMGDAVSLESSYAKVSEKSDFMRLRAKTMQREINEIRNKVSGRDSKLEASYFYLITKMQLVADLPTWWGAYEKAMHENGVNEAKAIALADQAVIDAQGAGQVKDLAQVQRGSPAWKLFTNFYSFFNTTFNLTAEAFGRTKWNSGKSVALLAADLALLYTIPALLGTLMKAMLSGEWDDVWRRLIADQLNYLFGTVVVLREAGAGVQAVMGVQGADYQGPASVRLFSAVSKLAKQAEQGEADEAFWKALNELGGNIFHYPAGQINATADGLYSLATGETKNPGALLVGHK